MISDSSAEFDEFIILQRFCPIVGTEDFTFDFFKFGCDEAFGVSHGLLPLVVVGSLIGFRFGNFNKVAKDVVEFNFKGVDSSARSLGSLHFGNPLFSGAGGISELV